MTMPEPISAQKTGKIDKYAIITWNDIEQVMNLLGLKQNQWFADRGFSPLNFDQPDDKADWVCLLLTEIWQRYYEGYDDNGKRVKPVGWMALPYEVRDFYIRATHCEEDALIEKRDGFKNNSLLPLDWPRDKAPHVL